VTTFERTLWLVHRRDGSLIEVALDIGHIEARGKRTSICELELELKAGEPTALFEVAQQIARTVAVLPANLSKAQRGFLLAQDGLDQPERSQAPRLTFDLTRPALAQRVLREMFTQFTGNLNALRTSDDPEVVHQARVGWRRFKSGVRLFNKMFKENPPPSWLELRPLLDCLGELRNLDVARDETLPPLANAYVMGDDQRANDWQALTQSLEQTAKQQRKAVRYALQEPVVGMSLLATSQWLENLSDGDENKQIPKDKLRHWAKSRILRMHQQMEAAHQSAATPEGFHRARILAKRLRYGTEALRDLLPKQLAKYCHQQSCSLQSSIGSTRDITQASELVARLEVDRGVVEFFRGVALGAVLSSALMTPAKHMTP
jgi:inorganic triphosphatase YgiF